MALSEFGSLKREFYIAEIRTWEIYGAKRVWRFIWGGDITRFYCTCLIVGAQWLSGRVLDSRQRHRGFKPHRRHCVVVLEQDTFILA